MKMSDVFDLPVSAPVKTDDEMYNDIGVWLAEFGSRRSAIAAAHAINHHDQLKEELELLKAKYAAVCKELEQATVELDELRSNGK